jgi:hypothetical protein
VARRSRATSPLVWKSGDFKFDCDFFPIFNLWGMMKPSTLG